MIIGNKLFIHIIFFTFIFSSCSVKVTKENSSYPTISKNLVIIEEKIRANQLKEAEKNLKKIKEHQLSPKDWAHFHLVTAYFYLKSNLLEKSLEHFQKVSDHKNILPLKIKFNYYLYYADFWEHSKNIHKALSLVEEGLKLIPPEEIKILFFSKRIIYFIYNNTPEHIINRQIQNFEFAADYLIQNINYDRDELAEIFWQASIFPIESLNDNQYSTALKIVQWLQNPRSKCLTLSSESKWAKLSFLKSKSEYEFLIKLAANPTLQRQPTSENPNDSSLNKSELIKTRMHEILELVHNYEREFPSPFPRTDFPYQYQLNDFLNHIKKEAKTSINREISNYTPTRQGPIKNNILSNDPRSEESK